jgi:hypothetical protein
MQPMSLSYFWRNRRKQWSAEDKKTNVEEGVLYPSSDHSADFRTAEMAILESGGIQRT